ncbi:MAG: DUF4296 domain-containing protein [Saprospiraceae bacterium]
MMRRLLTFILLASLALSCNGGKVEPLQIQKQKLIPLLLDLSIARSGNAIVSQFDSLPNEHFMQILEKHHISKAQLDHDLLVLSNQPKIAEEVYTAVLDSLNTPK